MSGFRGTKGPWVMYDQEPHIVTETLFGVSYYAENDHEIFTALGRTPEKAKINALLISKAPEMLEKIKESLAVIKWYMENTKPDNDDYDTFFNLGANQISSTKQLIKDATTL